MLKNIVTRRTFIQYLTGSIAVGLLPQSILAEHPTETAPTITAHHQDDGDFVIIDGWVLLKTDLEQ